MSRTRQIASLIAVAVSIAGASSDAGAASVLIRNATVHTMSAAGTLRGTDILITDGVVSQIGAGLSAPDAQVIDAKGQPVTPGLFGGITHLGIEEIGFEPTTADFALKTGMIRPEFDVTTAFDPESTTIGVNRLGGITFAAVTPGVTQGSTIVAGEGAVFRLDGNSGPHSRILVVELGGDANELAGGSRAAQFMLLRQAILEARTPNTLLDGDERLLTPRGRQVLREFLEGAGVVVFDVDRAADIRQTLEFAMREKLRIAILGAAEGWRVAADLAAAKVPVIIDALEDLPGSFDSIGATLENAARLHKGGVRVAFTLGSADEPYNVRKIRQAAGVAVANGLPWDAALAGLTSVPAEIFSVNDRCGAIERGRRADLVLWSGDPLEVTSLPERVFIDGQLQPDRSRQTELRDRYLERVRSGTAR
jgi:imidazolonepropionase-like amidohydrolase